MTLLLGFLTRSDMIWRAGVAAEVNPLLAAHHYLGPIKAGGHRLIVVGERENEIVAAQVWRLPTSRRLPSDGSWLELSRWCLTPAAGTNAGSQHHKWAVRLIRDRLPAATTLVSYSDPSQGHTGALYRACNWYWAPTWHRLRPPPTGNGAWITGQRQSVKDRWCFNLQKDSGRTELLEIEEAAIRHWRPTATEAEKRWARDNVQLREPA